MKRKIHEKINIINDIIIEAFKNLKVHECSQKNNVFVFDENYAVDCIEPKQSKISFKVRDKYLVNLCIISFERKGFSLKYSTDFFWILKEKRKSFELTCSVTDKLKLDVGSIEQELENVFNNTISQRIDLDYEKMMDVLDATIEQYMFYRDSIDEII